MRFLNVPSLLVGLLIFGIFSCKDLNTEKPAIIQVTGSLESRISTVKLPILLPVTELEDIVNQEIKGILHEDTSFEEPNNDHLMLRVERNGQIEVAMEGNKIFSTFPLSVWAKAKKVVSVESEFSLTVSVESVVSIESDWKPRFNTSFRSLKWNEKPELDITFIKIDLTNPVEDALMKKMPMLLNKIDSVAHQKINLKKTIEKVWADIQNPVLINKEYEKIWLIAQPKSISLEKISARAGMIHLDTEVESLLSFEFNDKPAVKKVSLPKLKHKQSNNDEFDIYLLAKVPFKEMSQKALRQLKGKEFKFKDYSASLVNLEIEGTENGLLVMIEMTGDAEGKLYFTGQPKYDSVSTEIRIDNFDFDVNTENVLAKSADWLLHDDVKKMIQKELHIPLKPFSEKLPELIEQGIAKSKTGENVSVKFNDFWFEPKEMLLTNQNLQALINVRGKVKLELSNLNQ